MNSLRPFRPNRIAYRASVVVLAAAPMFIGCDSTPSQDDVFSNVQRLSTDRGGGIIQWNRNSAQDRQAADAVAKLLIDELTVEEAIQVALLNNRHLQAMYEDLGVAQADLVEAGLLRNPIFHAEIGFPEGGETESSDGDFGFGAAPAAFPGFHALCHPTPAVSGGGFNGPTLDLSVAFDFIDILFIPLRKRIAADQLKAAEAIAAGGVLDLAGRVRTEFYELQALQQALEMRQLVLDSTDAGQDLARRLGAAGNLNDLRVAQERARHEQAKLDLATAEEQVLHAREALNRLMGLWGGQTQWTATPRLPEIPDEEPAWENVEAKSVEKSLDLEASRRGLFALARRAGVSRQEGLVPSADVGFSGTRSDDGEPWVLGPTFSVPIPLFNWGQATRARAMAELRRARQTYYASAVDLRSHARAARARVLSARRRAEYYQKVVLPLQQQIVDETQKRYNGMFESPFQLLIARREQLEAEGQHVAAVRDYWIARAEMEQLLNGRMPNGESGESAAPRMSGNSFHSQNVDAGH